MHRYVDSSKMHAPYNSPQLDLSGLGHDYPTTRQYLDISNFRAPYDHHSYYQDNTLFGLGKPDKPRRRRARRARRVGPSGARPLALIRPGSRIESMVLRRQVVNRPVRTAMRGFGEEDASVTEVVAPDEGSSNRLLIGLCVGVLAGAVAGWFLLGGKKEVTPNRRRVRRNGKLRGSLNDADREMWVLNNEYLYSWQKTSRKGMREFIRTHRAEIDKVIRGEIDRPGSHTAGIYPKANRRHLRSNGRAKPQPESGYAYMGDESVHDKNFRRVRDDAWEIVLITPSKAGPWHYLGKRYIDGSQCNVWRVIEPMTGMPVWYAQTALGE